MTEALQSQGERGATVSDVTAEMTALAHRLIAAAAAADVAAARRVRDEAWAHVEAFEGSGPRFEDQKYQGACLLHRIASDWLEKGRSVEPEEVWGELEQAIPGITRPDPSFANRPRSVPRLLLWTVTSANHDAILLGDVVEVANHTLVRLATAEPTLDPEEVAKEKVLWTLVQRAATERPGVEAEDFDAWSEKWRSWFDYVLMAVPGEH